MSSLRSKIIPRGVGLKLALWFAALFTGFSIACLVLAYVFAAKALRQTARDEVVAIATSLAPYARLDALPELAAAVRRLDDGDEAKLFVRLTSADGVVLYFDQEFDDLDEFTSLPHPGEAGIAFGRGHWNEILSNEADEHLELYSERLASGLWLEVGRSSEEREDFLLGVRSQLPWIAIAFFAGGLFAGLFFTNRALRPIRDLIATVTAIKAGDIKARVQVSGTHDELDHLKELFNGMLDQIERLIEGMRRTTDGLAHDIKTPVARLRADAELALRSTAAPEELREALITTIENGDQIIALVDALMDVSEAEAHALELEATAVDIDTLLADVMDLYQMTAEDAEVALAHEPSPQGPALVKGDMIQLRRVFANLVDNAIKYTPPGGRVVVRCERAASRWRVSVEDDGIGIPATELPHVWSRLFRGDASRSRRGMGLGLSLVKAIVGLHGGAASVASEPGKGSKFSVEFPALPQLEGPRP